MSQVGLDDLLEYVGGVDFSRDLLCEERMKTLTTALQKITEMVKQSENRSKLSETTLKKLCSILGSCMTPSEASEGAPLTDVQSAVTVCSWCLRCLRNSCVQSPSNQKIIWDAGAVDSLKQLVGLVSSAPSPKPEELAMCLRCAVQLLGNLVSGNPDLQVLVWKEVFPHTLLSVFQCADSKACQYLCMVINTCVQESSSASHTCQLWTCDERYQLVEAVLALCETESEQDFSLQLLQTLIGIPEFVPSVFAHLSPSSRIILLDILAAFLSQSDDNDASPLPKEPTEQNQEEESPLSLSVEFLAQLFEEEAGCVFGLVSEEQWSDIEDEKKPLLVLRLLKVLCEASTQPQAKRTLQQRTSLLEFSLGLLDRAHNVGKKSKNHFTSTQTLRDVDAHANPVFGFKRDLVRLIGNMCHAHPSIQDKVRELHGIPILLEQCNIDDSNPFISQWAILAIRNLCDGNLQNQAVIADMTNQGVVNNDQLEKYGFQAEYREGKMYYRSSRKK